jgi:hypothetical protein
VKQVFNMQKNYQSVPSRTAQASTLKGLTEQPEFAEVPGSAGEDGCQLSLQLRDTAYEIPVNGPLSFEITARPSGHASEIAISFDDIQPRD